jgi:pimeloyl-ACP methyl ester carboxylesterase
VDESKSSSSVPVTGEASHLASVPRAYSTRRVPVEAMRFLRRDVAPSSGDLVLARVQRLGQHFRLHLPNGRRRDLFPGDEIIVSYADRYAPSQYEAFVPSDLAPCHLVASGGIAARVISGNSKLSRRPTEIVPLGLITSHADGPPLNLAGYGLPRPAARERSVLTLAVVGSSMDSGKTTALAHLARAIRNLGLRVGYAKVTGTAAGGDPWLLVDAGADPVLDFTDAGYASTYRVPLPALESVAEFLTGHLESSGVDVALLEVADGLFQPETAGILASERFRALVDGMLYAAVDALGAAHGASLLADLGYRLFGFTGMLSTAPLLAREAQSAADLPVFGRAALGDASVAAKLIADVRAARSSAAMPSEVSLAPGSAPRVAQTTPRGRVLPRRTHTCGLDHLVYVPTTVTPDAPLLIAVHGYSRNAWEQAECFAPLCEASGMVLAAPHFSEAEWSNYQRLGGAGEGPRADHALDEMVLELRRELDLLLGHVSLFGYSGGGQFAHRYVMAHPARITSAVVAAPGWYTFPDRERPYPYGARIGSRLEGVRMEAESFLRVPMLVVVGEHDDDERSEHLRRSPRLDQQQGTSRLERATRWVSAMQDAAAALGTPPRVRFASIPGAGHSFTECMENGLGELVLEHIGAPPETLRRDHKPQHPLGRPSIPMSSPRESIV